MQVQIINGKISIFLIINFDITKNTKFIFSLTLYSDRNLRNLETEKEVSFYPNEDYEGNGDKIVTLTSEENVGITRVKIKEIKNDEIELKILNNDNNLLDTEKVKESINNGGVDFSKVGSDYSISQYKIVSSSIGCEFSLNSENEISQNNKNIKLSFKEVETNKNLEVDCTLSSENGKKINCKLPNNIDSDYILEPYISQEEKELITIVQKDVSDYLQLLCESTENPSPTPITNNKRGGGVSAGAIIGVIVGIIFIIIAVVVVVIIYKKIRKNKTNDNSTFVSKFYEYPSTASNIQI